MPVRDSIVLPSSDSDIDPAALAVAERMLNEVGCPQRSWYAPAHLASVFDETERTWQRRCESDEIGAFRKGRDWIIPRSWLLVYVAQRQNVISMN